MNKALIFNNDGSKHLIFYSGLGYDVIWLYDLPRANVKPLENGEIDILEDNARGFFRISENPNNLRNHSVFIQVKSGLIYKVSELMRRESGSEFMSSIRYFVPEIIYTEQEFVEAIKNNTVGLSSLDSLWSPGLDWIIVEDTSEHKTIMINRDKKGNMFRSFSNGFIQYKYVTCTFENNQFKWYRNKDKDYSLRYNKERSKIWKLIRAQGIRAIP